MEFIDNQDKLANSKLPKKSLSFAGRIAGSLAVAGSIFLGTSHQASHATPDKDVVGTSELTHRLVTPGLAMDTENVGNRRIELKTVMQGIESNLTVEEDVIIADKETLEKYWPLINNEPDRIIPTLKDGEVIVLTARGQKKTLTATRIDRIERDGENVNIYITDYLSQKEQDTSAFDAQQTDPEGLPLSFIHRTINDDFDYNVASSAIGNVIGPQTLDITTEAP